MELQGQRLADMVVGGMQGFPSPISLIWKLLTDTGLREGLRERKQCEDLGGSRESKREELRWQPGGSE